MFKWIKNGIKIFLNNLLGSIVDLNVMYVLKVDMIIDKTEQFQLFFTHHKQIKDIKAHYALRNALIEHL